MTEPSRTTNPLHLTDLAHTRFEDLCLALLYPLRAWDDIRHYGRSGDDDGIDIYARESVEDDSPREWLVQCRRYKRAAKATLVKAVDDALQRTEQPPDVLLVVVACDVSKKAHEAFTEYATSKGVKQPLVWTQSIIETMLHSSRPDLLFTFFGVSEAGRVRRKQMSIRRNIALKKRLCKELVYKVGDDRAPDRRERLRSPAAKFSCSNLIIHSVDDTAYPGVDDQVPGISGWFKVEPYDFYHNGIQVVLRGVSVVVEKDSRRWSLLDYDERDTVDSERFVCTSAGMVGCIPYRNIAELDEMGDEYYSQPHLYCLFADGGEPYEEFRYYVTSPEGAEFFLENDDQFDYKAEIQSARKKVTKATRKVAGKKKRKRSR